MKALLVVIGAILLTGFGAYWTWRPAALAGLMKTQESRARLQAIVLLVVGLVLCIICALGAWGLYLIVSDPTD